MTNHFHSLSDGSRVVSHLLQDELHGRVTKDCLHLRVLHCLFATFLGTTLGKAFINSSCSFLTSMYNKRVQRKQRIQERERKKESRSVLYWYECTRIRKWLLTGLLGSISRAFSYACLALAISFIPRRAWPLRTWALTWRKQQMLTIFLSAIPASAAILTKLWIQSSTFVTVLKKD